MAGKSSPIVLVLFALGVSAIAPAKGGKEEIPELNQRVLAFAREHLGEKVGDGSCVSLAIEALSSAGAREFPEAGADEPADYVWGEPVETPNKLLPGDILQFRVAVFAGSDATKSWRKTFPHHTAIVAGVSKTKAGFVVTILQQNAGRATSKIAERQVVKQDRLRFRDLRPGGVVKGYRPKKK